MADVATKIISANAIRNGSLTIKTGVDVFQFIRNNPAPSLTVNQLESKLDTRLDDPRYYEGDATA